MKRIYSIVLVAGTIFSAASCQKEMADQSLSNGGDFTITATTVADTKTVLDDVNDVIYWAPGDKISVFDADNTPIEFGTDITEKSTTAKFTAPEFSAPTGDIVAIYPDAATAAAGYTYDSETDKINNIRVQGKQNAVANSFDPRFGAAYAKGSADNLQFNNLHCLIKFTVADNDISSLTISGTAMLAGSIGYSIETGEVTWNGGAAEVTLNGDMTVGNTYYIALLPNTTAHSNLRITVGGKEVWSRNESIELKPNKIYNIGSISMPEPTDGLTVERVWNIASENGNPWQSVLGFSQNEARNIAMDDEYIYVTSSNSVTPKIKAISIADKSVIKDVNVEGISGGTHLTSCCKVIKNTDPAINNGKDVLFVSNLASGAAVKLYVYLDGIDNAPTLYLLNNFRRYGDKFTYEGTLQEGEIRFLDQGTSGAVGKYPVKDGKIATWQSDGGWDPSDRFGVPAYGGIGEVVTYPGSLTYALYTTQTKGIFVTLNGTTHNEVAWTTDPNLDLTYGYTFFDYNKKKYIAYARIDDSSRANGSLEIIEDKGTAEQFKASLEAQSNLISTPVLDSDSSVTAGSNVAACAVHEGTDGNLYAAVCVNDCGLALYRIK